MTVKLSVTSKLDGIRSWSLQALDTCPGSLNPITKELVEACSGCYATQGNYRFPNVKAPRLFNLDDWQREEWVSDMVKALSNQPFFRWFDSGDMYTLKLAKKILQIMALTPNTAHWLPTRMYKFDKFTNTLDTMKALPNVSVRYSSDSILGVYVQEYHGSVIVPTLEDIPADVSPCLAYENDGKCSGCRNCWDKDIPVIGYIAHGKSMAKRVRESLAAAGMMG